MFTNFIMSQIIGLLVSELDENFDLLPSVPASRGLEAVTVGVLCGSVTLACRLFSTRAASECKFM